MNLSIPHIFVCAGHTQRRLLTTLAFSAVLLGCENRSAAPAAATAQPVISAAPKLAETPATEARRVFDSRCVTCHGTHGAGDGLAAAALNPKPRAFADAAWQTSVDDARLAKVIVEGGPAVNLSAGMAPNPDLQSKPEVVSELIKIVRAFKR
jgi:cytochrome c5